MTVEQGQTQQRYQGYVPLEDETLEAAAHTYFRQSEQIPTRIRLAVAEMYDRDAEGAARRSWRAGGIIGQFLPVSEERVRRRDLPAGDVPEGRERAPEPEDDDAWVEAQALIDTVEDHELTDPSIAAERLLYRLFHERGVRVFEPMSLEENCSCSRERIEQVLRQMGPEEIDEAAADGAIEVRCEFCGAQYRFDPAEIASSSLRAAPEAACEHVDMPGLTRHRSVTVSVFELPRHRCRIKSGMTTGCRNGCRLVQHPLPARHVERERRDVDGENLAVVVDRLVGADHRAGRRRAAGSRSYR